MEMSGSEQNRPMDVVKASSEDIILCQVCENAPKQYKCPRCALYTCSLTCCKTHKQKFQCSGKRDKTAFIPRSELGESHLRSDYHFLEDVLQLKDCAKRNINTNFGGNFSNKNLDSNKRQKVSSSSSSSRSSIEVTPSMDESGKKPEVLSPPASLSSLQILSPLPEESTVFQFPDPRLGTMSKSVKKLYYATKERNINLVLMSNGMTKRKTNTSRLQSQTKTIYWKLHIVFILNSSYRKMDLLSADADHKSTEQFSIVSDSLVLVRLNSINESSSIQSLLDSFWGAAPDRLQIRHAIRSLRINNKNEDIRCLMQILPSSSANPKFYELNKQESLMENLKGKTVIEYPTLYFGTRDSTKGLHTLLEMIN